MFAEERVERFLGDGIVGSAVTRAKEIVRLHQGKVEKLGLAVFEQELLTSEMIEVILHRDDNPGCSS